MEVKGLSGIVAMDVGLNNEMVVWEVRWKQTMMIAIHVNGELRCVNVTYFKFI